MYRVEMTSIPSATTEVVERTPVRDLAEVLNQIQVDAHAHSAEYLAETEVPHGGE